MKELALLVFALPLAACTTSQSTLHQQTAQLVDARSACANLGVLPTDTHYASCLKRATVENNNFAHEPFWKPGDNPSNIGY